MKTLEMLRFQMEFSKKMTAGLLADMLEAPLTQPTTNGGNHPTWIAGHLAYSEANLISHIMRGNTNPLLEWKELFGRGTEPSTDTNKYPPLSELLAKWDEVRAETLKVVDSLSEEDLDKPCPNPPPGREEFFGTYAKVLAMVSMHTLMHRGQVADARRAANRDVLMV